MNKLLIGTVALAAIAAGPAMAADMPVKAPPPVVSYYDWTGVYLGASVGWVRSSYDWRYTNPAPATCCAPFSASAEDAIFDLHIGAQQQWGWLVVGVEAAWNGFARGNQASSVGCVAPNSFTTTCQIQPRDIPTAGGRIGIAWTNWLFYGDAGAAWSSVHTQLFNPGGNALPFDLTTARYNGWYAGGGLEYVIHKGSLVDVIVGAEYQHIDLSDQLHSSPLDAFGPCPPGVNCRRVSAKEDIARARLSIKTHGWSFLAP